MSNKVFTLDKINSFLESTIDSSYDNLTSDEILEKLESGLSSLETDNNDLWELYTSRDATEVRNSLVQKIQSIEDNTSWTDFNESDAGAVLIELIAGYADMLGFYLDKQSLECFIDSVKQRKNGAAILRLIGYKLHMTKSATADGEFYIDNSVDYDITIPKYTQLSAELNDGSKIYYATKDECTIVAGHTSVDVELIQGAVSTATVQVGKLTSNRIYLPDVDIAEGSVLMKVDDAYWTEEKDVLLDDIDGTKFSVYEDKNCRPYVLLQNSYKNYLKDNTSIITFTYLISVGLDGKVNSGDISNIESKISTNVDDIDMDITSMIHVRNKENSAGGSYRESLDEARISAPNTLETTGYAITLRNFQALTDAYNGVLKSSALDWSVDEHKYVPVPYEVDLYIVPKDGGYCSDSFLNEIKDYFESIRCSTVEVFPKTANYMEIDIDATITAQVTNAKLGALKRRIMNALNNYFDPKNLSFGQTITTAELIVLIKESSPLISEVILDSPADTISCDLTQFPKLGDVSIDIQSS